MTAVVRKLPQAEADLKEIGYYIGRQSGSVIVATRYLADLDARMEAYARQPLMGESREDLGPDLRSFSFRRNYVVIYRPLADGIDVLRVFHTARDYGRLFHAGE